MAALILATAPPQPVPDRPTAPYVSCRDGYVAPTLADCPTVQKPKPPPGPGVGHGGAGGLLGLGGLGGIL